MSESDARVVATTAHNIPGHTRMIVAQVFMCMRYEHDTFRCCVPVWGGGLRLSVLYILMQGLRGCDSKKNDAPRPVHRG